MRCCFREPATKHDKEEADFRDLLVSSATANTTEPIPTEAQIITAAAPKAEGAVPAAESGQPAAPAADGSPPSESAGTGQADETDAAQRDSKEVATDEVVLQQECQQCNPAADAEPSMLLPAIKFFVHDVTDNQRLAIDQLVSVVCHQLGEGAVRSVQGEYKAEEAVPPSNTVLGYLKGFDFPAFFEHAQQLPGQMLMVLLVLSGQKTSASKQQPVSVSLRKARRIKAAAEKHFSSSWMDSSRPLQQQQQSPRPQAVMTAEKFKKLLLEADPSAYTLTDSNITESSRDSYTGRDAALTIDTAAEVLATASAATRDQFSSKFGEASVEGQNTIKTADMKKCLPAIHRLRNQDSSITRALLRSETNDMSTARGVPVLRQFAAEYTSNPRYAANPDLPVTLPALTSPPCCSTTAVRRLSSDAHKQLQTAQV